jgi:hypothetical protein
MAKIKALAKTISVLASGIIALTLNPGCVSTDQTDFESDTSKPIIPKSTEQYPTGYPGFSLRTMRFQNESPEIRNHENTLDSLRARRGAPKK